MGSHRPQVTIPEVPARYRACFQKLAHRPPPKGGWTLNQAAQLIADLSVSEVEKSRCGRDLINWANSLR